MDKSLYEILQDNGFSLKEAKVYTTSLQLGAAPVSTIARHMRENRVTVYSILKNLIARGIAKSVTKKNTTYYSMVDAENLLQKFSQRLDRFQQVIPELMAITSKVDSKVKTQFYEWLEWLKSVYEQALSESDKYMQPDEPFLVFLGTWEIDPAFANYIEKEFLPRRKTFPRKAKAILSGHKSNYEDYMYSTHDCIVIDDPLFALANEIVVYWEDRVLILMYAPSEMAALVIQSKTLSDALKSLFHLVRKMHKKLYPKKK